MRAITWEKFSKDTQSIAASITQQQQTYDLIVCVMRGGCVPSSILSNALDTPMLALGVRSYAEQQSGEVSVYQSFISDLYYMKGHTTIDKVLVVDDLSDTGGTFEYFIRTYKDLFGTIHTAAPYIKTGTKHIPTYYTEEFNSSEWLEFPWETPLVDTKYLHAV